MSHFDFEFIFQNLSRILKGGQNRSCRALQNLKLLYCYFFMLLRKINNNFGISVLPQFKLNLHSIWEFEIFVVFQKSKPFHSKPELEP